MSKVAISGSSSGTATYTIQSPSGSTDRVLTLPDATGTMLVSGQPVTATTGNFSGDVTLGSSVLATPTGSAPSYTCRAWVNFDGIGTVAIRASGNVSSITDNGTGDYTVNFTTAMPDVNYCAVSGAGLINDTNEFASQCNVNGPYSTTSIRIATGYVLSTADSKADRSVIQISIFR
jgi:hypothetical protein